MFTINHNKIENWFAEKKQKFNGAFSQPPPQTLNRHGTLLFALEHAAVGRKHEIWEAGFDFLPLLPLAASPETEISRLSLKKRVGTRDEANDESQDGSGPGCQNFMPERFHL